jgi:hypothetical protein
MHPDFKSACSSAVCAEDARRQNQNTNMPTAAPNIINVANETTTMVGIELG